MRLLLIGIVSFLMGFCLAGWSAEDAVKSPQKQEAATAQNREIEQLIENLGHDDWTVRETATDKLNEIGQPAVPFLKKALANQDAEIVMRARLLLRLLKWNIPSELKIQIGNLMIGYEDAPPDQRRQIILQLFSHQKSALPVLFKILEFEQEHEVAAQAYEFSTRFLNDTAVADSALVLLKGTDTFWTHRLIGRIYELRRKYFEAIPHYEKAFQLNPSFTALVSTLQNLYQQTQNWSQAIKFYQTLIAANPKIAEYHINLGLMHDYNGEKETAQNIWQKTSELSGLDENHYDRLATIYLERGQNDRAVQTYQTAANRLPANINLKVKSAQTCRKTGRFNEARGILEPLLNSKQPKEIMWNILEELGRCYFLDNKPEEAKKNWWKLVDSSVLAGASVIPDDYLFLGSIFEEYELFDEQLKLYEKAYRQYSNRQAIAYNLARVNVRKGDFKNSLKILLDSYLNIDLPEMDERSEFLINYTNPDLNPHFFIITCLSDPTLPSFAAGLIEEKLAALPAPPQPLQESDILRKYKLLSLLCHSYAIENNTKQIGQVLEEAFKNKEADNFSFEYFPYLYKLSSFARAAQKYDLARNIYNTMLTKCADSVAETAEIRRLIGVSFLEEGLPQEAKPFWNTPEKIQELIKSNNNQYSWQWILKRESNTLIQYGLPEIARANYENLLKNQSLDNSTKSWLYVNYGRTFATTPEEWPQTLDCYLKAKLIATTFVSPFPAERAGFEGDEIDDLIAGLLLETGLFPDRIGTGKHAIEKISQTIEQIPDGPDKNIQKTALLTTIARIYQLNGQSDKAIESLKSALTLNPDNEEFLYRLGALYRTNKQFQEALDIYEKLIPLNRADPKPLYLKAITAGQTGDEDLKEKTMQTINAATRGFPEERHYEIADYLTKIDLSEPAETEWHQVLKKAPFETLADCNAYGYLAEISAKKQDFEKALDYNRRQRPMILPEGLVIYVDLKTLFGSQPFYIFEPFEKFPFIDASLDYLAGQDARQNNRPEEAVQKYRHSLEILPVETNILKELAQLGIDREKLFSSAERLIKYYQTKSRLYPESAYYYLRLAETHLLWGQDLETGEKFLTQARQLAPELLDNYVLLAKYAQRKKDYQTAERMIQSLINIKPDNQDYRKLLEEFIKERDK